MLLCFQKNWLWHTIQFSEKAEGNTWRACINQIKKSEEMQAFTYLSLNVKFSMHLCAFSSFKVIHWPSVKWNYIKVRMSWCSRFTHPSVENSLNGLHFTVPAMKLHLQYWRVIESKALFKVRLGNVDFYCRRKRFQFVWYMKITFNRLRYIYSRQLQHFDQNWNATSY